MLVYACLLEALDLGFFYLTEFDDFYRVHFLQGD